MTTQPWWSVPSYKWSICLISYVIAIAYSRDKRKTNKIASCSSKELFNCLRDSTFGTATCSTSLFDRFCNYFFFGSYSFFSPEIVNGGTPNPLATNSCNISGSLKFPAWWPWRSLHCFLASRPPSDYEEVTQRRIFCSSLNSGKMNLVAVEMTLTLQKESE